MTDIKEAQGLEVVAYRVSAPLEPELGHWFDEDEHYDLNSEPLCSMPKAQAVIDQLTVERDAARESMIGLDEITEQQSELIAQLRAEIEELAALKAQEPSVADWPEIGLPPAGSVCEARIPHHTSEGRQMIWAEVEVLAHALVDGVPYSWVKETGSAGSIYAPMMLSFRTCEGRKQTVKQSLTVAKDQHARDSAELRRLCAERDKLRERVAELEESNRSWVLRIQQRGIEMDEMSQLIEDQVAELAALKAQEPVATVTIQHFRQDPSMENVEFQLQAPIPQGTHKLYASPVAQQKVVMDREQYHQIAFEVTGMNEDHCFVGGELDEFVARLNGGKP